MNFSLYIAKRYLFSKSSNNTINIITIIATLGVIIGTMALFIVLSGFSGLKTFSVSSLQTADPDFKITAVKGKSFEFTPAFKTSLNEINGIENYTPVIEERAFFEFKSKTHIAYIKGVTENYTNINNLDTALVVGTWIDFEYENFAVIGNSISNKLSMGINDYLEPLKIYVPKPGSGYVTSIKDDLSIVFAHPVGIFAITEEIDRKFVFIPLTMAQQLLSYGPNQISAVEVKVLDINDRETIISTLQQKLGDGFKIQTREQLNSAIYKMLNTENLFVYLLSTLVLILFLVNLIGTLIIIIHDKKENIKTLNSIGLEFKKIKRIFLIQGFLLCLFGLVVGLVLAIILVFLQKTYSLFMITPSIAFPIEFRINNVILVFLTISILGFIASKIASGRISKRVMEES